MSKAKEKPVRGPDRTQELALSKAAIASDPDAGVEQLLPPDASRVLSSSLADVGWAPCAWMPAMSPDAGVKR